MEAECPLTIWCSAMTSSPPVGTYCLFPHNNVKRQTESHTAFLNCNIIYWRLDDTGELLSEKRTDASLSGGRWVERLRSVNVRLFVFLTHAPVAVRSCTSKTSTAGVHSAQITAVWLVTCHVALKTKKLHPAIRLSSVQLTQVFNQIISLLRKVTHGEKNDQGSFHQASKMENF